MIKKNGPWTIRESKEIYKSEFITVIEDQVIKPDRSEGDYATVQMKSGACVLPLDDDDNVYLIKQFRYVLGADSLELPCGGVDDGRPRETAGLELKQELGLEAGELIDFGTAEMDTSIVRSTAHFFVAKDLTFGEPEREGSEVMKTVKLSFDEALEKVLSGEIKHSLSCILILKAHLLLKNKAGLKK